MQLHITGKNNLNNKQAKRKRRNRRNRIAGALVIMIGLAVIFMNMSRGDNRVILKQDQEDYMKKILQNEASYPEELVALALRKEEARAFVYNYLENKEVGSKNINIKAEYNKGTIPLFIQWDERWGYEPYGDTYMAINGCGPTTLAMVAVGLTGNLEVNPKVVADYSDHHGHYVPQVGTSWSLMTEGAKAFGIKGEELALSENTILGALKNGEPIIASMGPGIFTTGGHFVLLTGVTEDGKILINDSDSKIRSEQVWEIDVFMKECKNLWKFSV